jgi:dTDP-4-dehydrorhamnose reductase
MDIADPDSVEAMLDQIRPWALVNAAGYVRVDEAEEEGWQCHRENAVGPGILAEACARRGIRLVTFSSDLVFDGGGSVPYRESDRVAPINEYGRSKAEGERRVLLAMPEALVIRTSAFFGPWDDHNFVTGALRRLAAGEPVVAAGDAVVSPTYVPDLVHAALDLLIDGEGGIWHLTNGGEINWHDLAREAARLCGLDPEGIEWRGTHQLGLKAPRPLYTPLGSERGTILPPLGDALARYVRECGRIRPHAHGSGQEGAERREERNIELLTH